MAKLAAIAVSVTTDGHSRVKPCDCFIAKAQMISRIPAVMRANHAMAASLQSCRAVPDLNLRKEGEDVASRRSDGSGKAGNQARRPDERRVTRERALTTSAPCLSIAI